MNFFSKIFKGTIESPEDPDVLFGRYSDAYKSDEKYEAWDDSILMFEKQEYGKAYNKFFSYLLNENEDNVAWFEEDDVLRFQILQGSKKIVGHIDDEVIKAEAKIATTNGLNVGFLRRMVEQNYTLKYGRYALDENDNLTLVFDSYLLDGSPYKLYYALKEIGINADKQDDLLVAEFDQLEPIHTAHLIEIPEEEKKVKFDYLHQSINQLFDTIDRSKLNADQYAGGIAYTMLNVCYRLDYLIKPEGKTTELLERIHRVYFAQDGKGTVEKNQVIRKKLKKILETKEEMFYKELYRTPSSFGITNPNNHDQFVSFIDGELPNMDWYADHKHFEIAKSIPGYIIGYCLFNYALPLPDKELLHLFYYITENAYFKALGFHEHFYAAETSKYDKKSIKRAFERIQKKYEARYPKLDIKINTLDFSSDHGFAKSYLLMLKDLDLTKV